MPRSPIAVIGGTGRQGRGIALRLAAAGSAVIVASRDPQRAADAMSTWSIARDSIVSATYHDAIARADVVILAVPFESVGQLLEIHGPAFRPNTLVVDVTVPIVFAGGSASLVQPPEGSAAEYVNARLPSHVRLAATFKTIPAVLLGKIDEPVDCDEFVCGDSTDARSEAAALVESVPGLRAVDVGPLRQSRSIEHLTLLAIEINRRHKVHEARFRIVGLKEAQLP